MKKQTSIRTKSKNFLHYALLVLIYLLGISVGTLAICIHPVLRQKDFFTSRVHQIAEEFPEGSNHTINRTWGANTRIFIYNNLGKCVVHVVPTNTDSDSEETNAKIMGSDLVDKYLEKVLSGEDVFSIAFAKDDQKYFSNILIIAAAPVKNGNSIVGAAFIIKNMMDIPEAIISYLCCFTIFYWCSACFILIYLRKIRKLDDLKQMHITNITHALKTPVASIKALAETLCDDMESDPEKKQLYCSMILKEANRQDHIIHDLLNLSKIQDKNLDLAKDRVSLNTIIGSFIDKYAELYDYMGITLHMDNSLNDIPMLYTNENCMKQIFEIILDNTLKFVSEGEDVWINAKVSGHHAIIEIKDNGIGIKKEDLPFIFDRFYKSNIAQNESGTGLGLAIAREIVLCLKEKIWAESKEGIYTSFFFTIQLSRRNCR